MKVYQNQSFYIVSGGGGHHAQYLLNYGAGSVATVSPPCRRGGPHAGEREQAHQFSITKLGRES